MVRGRAAIIVVLISGFVLGGCSYSHDGWFANPCNGFVWFIEIVGGPTFRITKDEMPEWFVSLPATACHGT